MQIEGKPIIPTKGHYEILGELLNVENKIVLDIGCGTGHLTRLMSTMEAKAIGIDPGSRQLERAVVEFIGNEKYIRGTAEKLPIRDNSIDIIVFFNSLHHVPVDQLGIALKEAYRTLQNEGILYISEPLAEGALFELSQPFNDETLVRREAYEAIKKSFNCGFLIKKELFYKSDVVYPDAKTYKENSISINIERQKYFREMGDKFNERFEQYGKKDVKGWKFSQVIRVNILKKN